MINLSKQCITERFLLMARPNNKVMNEEQYKKLLPEVQAQLNDTFHETLCESIITLLKDSIENNDLIKKEVQSAREFAKIKPDTDAAKELLEFLDSEEVREAVERYYSSRAY